MESHHSLSWSTVFFGKHKGKTIPQIVFADPDWFFWAIEAEAFRNKGNLSAEAKDVYKKVCHIRIPAKKGETLVAEYFIHPSTGKFGDFRIVSEDHPVHEGSSFMFPTNVIDLGIPRQIGQYDKLGYQIMMACLKYYIFGKTGTRMTKKRCEQFFEDSGNFE